MRQLARKAGIEPGYLSKIERGVERASEDTIVLLADALGESRDVLLAMDGRMSKRLLAIVIKRPDLLASWIEAVEKMPDDAVLRVVREVRDGKW
jgi:transcriptional regulator with XRE-family HTH domain